MDLCDRLRLVYTNAIKAQHTGVSVSIHVGCDVMQDLRDMARIPDADYSWLPRNTFFGFPIVEEDDLEPEAIHLRTTMVIP